MRRGLGLGLVVVTLLLAASIAVASPGYVSRDCPLAGAKESITVDWSLGGEWFFTLSYHARRTRGGLGQPTHEWVQYKSGSFWGFGWKSYAGQWGDWIQNYYYSGVDGHHYWYNRELHRVEYRRDWVSNCNLTVWGWNNW